MTKTTAPEPDLSAFQRAAFGSMSVYGSRSLSSQLEAFVTQIVNEESDPRLVPEAALERMKFHPAVYLAERVVTGIVRRSDLYSVEHEDPKVKAETEEWLWPLLPRVLNAFARAFAYGSRGVVFDWERKDLRFQVPKTSGEGTRAKTKVMHTHFGKAHTIRRSHFVPILLNDELESIEYGGESYGPDRAFLLVWDPEDEDDTRGNGARRRSWRDYCVDYILDVLELGYLEKSVDNPRVAFAPSGEITGADGVKIPIPDYVNGLLLALAGGGAITFPMEHDKSGNKKYELDTLDLPDREEIWATAISRREARIFMAHLALMGGEAAASAKTLDGLLKEVVQDIAEWVAKGLSLMVEQVHCRNYDPAKVPPPEVEATDVGKSSAKKILVELLRVVGGEELGSWIDAKKTLDRLGVPVHETRQERPTSKGEPGRKKDLTSDRQERREDAITEEGEDANGSEEADE